MQIERPSWTLWVDEAAGFLAAYLYTFILTFLIFPVVLLVIGQVIALFQFESGIEKFTSALQGGPAMLGVSYFFGSPLAVKAFLPGLAASALGFFLFRLCSPRNVEQRSWARLTFPASVGAGAFMGLAFEAAPSPAFLRWSQDVSTSFAMGIAATAAAVGVIVARRQWRQEIQYA
ncbi:hypothetical protein ACEWPM_003695 [Roseovarius sp. S4756]|uniref:hypothetical protein n=1 Tax=Roseovarius maritimus TaxID=3342637 RepID=UPI0037281D57